eukprot:1357120-Amphidinium_carterae.1
MPALFLTVRITVVFTHLMEMDSSTTAEVVKNHALDIVCTFVNYDTLLCLGHRASSAWPKQKQSGSDKPLPLLCSRGGGAV